MERITQIAYPALLIFLSVLFGCDGIVLDINPPDTGGTTYVLDVDTVGGGSVQVNHAGTSFKANTELRLQAVPDAGWEFDHWGGDAAGTASSITLIMNANKSVTAVFTELPANVVKLSVTTVGKGEVALAPAGDEIDGGFLYAEGATVSLDATPDPGWAFLGYYDSDHTLQSDQPGVDLVLDDSFSIVAEFGEIVIPPPPVFIDQEVYAADGQFLGVISDDPFDPDSLANPFGDYGDEFSDLSIWNPFGVYGTDFGDYSAYDLLAADPPDVREDGLFVAYLTKNPFFNPRIDPDEIAEAIGRFDVIRD